MSVVPPGFVVRGRVSFSGMDGRLEGCERSSVVRVSGFLWDCRRGFGLGVDRCGIRARVACGVVFGFAARLCGFSDAGSEVFGAGVRDCWWGRGALAN